MLKQSGFHGNTYRRFLIYQFPKAHKFKVSIVPLHPDSKESDWIKLETSFNPKVLLEITLLQYSEKYHPFCSQTQAEWQSNFKKKNVCKESYVSQRTFKLLSVEMLSNNAKERNLITFLAVLYITFSCGSFFTLKKSLLQANHCKDTFFIFQSFHSFEAHSKFHLTVGPRQNWWEGERLASDRRWWTKIPERGRGWEAKEGWRDDEAERQMETLSLRSLPGETNSQSELQRESDGNKTEGEGI